MIKIVAFSMRTVALIANSSSLASSFKTAAASPFPFGLNVFLTPSASFLHA